MSIIKNGQPFPPFQVSEVQIIDGVVEGVRLLKKNGFEVVVVTNQPDVARGSITQEAVENINQFLGNRIGLDYFYTCFHDDVNGCLCRKPKSGLLDQAAKDLDLDLNSSFLVGDRWRDIAAGQSAGCICYFIDYSYAERQPEMPYFSVGSLLQAVQHIVGS
jgi:D-glycero-D-manno-heptose 1,7-bisphosphate phosphatase